MNQRVKDLFLLMILDSCYNEEYGEKLISNEWLRENIKRIMEAEGFDTTDDNQLAINLKFYVNYEIMRLKDKLEKG
jgi:hypothetical protein